MFIVSNEFVYLNPYVAIYNKEKLPNEIKIVKCKCI